MYINHRCDGYNCEKHEGDKNNCWLIAIKLVEQGEELMYFYSEDFFVENNKNFECERENKRDREIRKEQRKREEEKEIETAPA